MNQVRDARWWVCFIYNSRGQLTPATWEEFKRFCESNDLMDDVGFGVKWDKQEKQT